MNFLAHFHLAWPDAGLVAGGLEGDFHKGPLCGALPRHLERGIRLHRAIDAYTDQHPLVRQLRRELPPGLRRYSGILIDLCFDHYLTRHWQRYSDMPLRDFSDAVYATLARHEQVLSDNARRMLQRLVEHDILALYADWATIPAAAASIGRRLRRSNPFLNVDRDLEAVRATLEQTFLAFYPELQAFSAERVHELPPG